MAQGSAVAYQRSSRPFSLPPLAQNKISSSKYSKRSKRRSGTSSSVLRSYIHGAEESQEPYRPQRHRVGTSGLKKVHTRRRSIDDFDVSYPPTAQKLREDFKIFPSRRTVRVFRNGDRSTVGIVFPFKIGEEFPDLDAFFEHVAPKIGLQKPARYVFDEFGNRKYFIGELLNGQIYVVSSHPAFIFADYRNRNVQNRPGTYSIKSSAVTIKAPVITVVKEEPTTSNEEDCFTRSESRTAATNIQKNSPSPIKEITNWSEELPAETIVPESSTIKSSRSFTVPSPTHHRKKYKHESETKFLTQKLERLKFSKAKISKSNLKSFSSEPILIEHTEEEDEETELSEGHTAIIYVKGERRVLQAPKPFTRHNPTKPAYALELDWVYGFRGIDAKRNLWITATDELLYFVGAVAVLYDPDENVQRHFTEHTEDINCMALHPSGEVAASCQKQSTNSSVIVLVWSVGSLLTLNVFHASEITAPVSAIGFSYKAAGSHLAIVDGSRDRVLSLWTWRTKQLLSKVATHQDHINGLEFHALDNSIIATFGENFLNLWLKRQGKLTRTNLLREQGATERTITAIEFSTTGDIFSGDENGDVTAWLLNLHGDYNISFQVSSHTGPVSSINLLEEEKILTTGENDRKICCWHVGQLFEKIYEFTLPENTFGIRSAQARLVENLIILYVGTLANSIFEGSIDTGFKQIVHGHRKQLLGLAVNENDGSIVTAGYDKQIVKWKGTQVDWAVQVQRECICVSIHPYSTVVAAGTIDGHVIVLTMASGTHVVTLRACAAPVSCLGYNLMGDMLVCGGQNGSLYFYKVIKNGLIYNRFGKITDYKPLSNIDWSHSGNFLQTNTSDYDVNYWRLRYLTMARNGVGIQDEEWITHNCTLSYMTNGIWSGYKKRKSPLYVSCDKNENRQLLVAGDADGVIRLYRYPVISGRAGFREYKAFSSYVSNARFSPEEDYLYTIGGTDATFMRWSLFVAHD